MDERWCVAARVPLEAAAVAHDAHAHVIGGQRVFRVAAAGTCLRMKSMATCAGERFRAVQHDHAPLAQ